MPIADKPNAVAIGTNSVTDDAVGVDGITINGTPHVFAGKQPASVVSFGSKARAGAGGVTQYNRQLTNVSAGQISADSLDAVNGSQLFAAVAEIETNAKQISKNKQNITTIEGDINTLNNRINDVSQNAINRANHYTDLQVNKGVAVGPNAKANEKAVAVGSSAKALELNSVAIGNEASADATQAISIGDKAHSKSSGVAVGVSADAALDGIAIGASAKTEKAKGIALGQEPILRGKMQLQWVLIVRRNPKLLWR